MKKKGFIAISMLYSFFIVFISIIFAIIAYYADSINNMRLLNESVIRNYNSVKYCTNCTPKIQKYSGFDSSGSSVLKTGDYVFIPIENYDGLFIVDSNKNLREEGSLYTSYVVNLISSQIVDIDTGYNTAVSSGTLNAYISKFKITDTTLVSRVSVSASNNINLYGFYDDFLKNNVLTIKKANYSDSYYNLYNVGDFYRVKFDSITSGYSKKVDGIIVPDCMCGSNSYANYLYSGGSYTSVSSPTLASWYNAVCGNTPLKTPVNECDIKLINTTVPPAATLKSGLRLTLTLNQNLVIKAGSGKQDDPYILGVNK